MLPTKTPTMAEETIESYRLTASCMYILLYILFFLKKYQTSYSSFCLKQNTS